MYKSIALSAISLLLVLAGNAQGQQETTCRVRFAVIPKYGPDEEGMWPQDAKRWWLEEGENKFSELCEASRKQSDFVLTWYEYRTTETHVTFTGGKQTGGPPQADQVCSSGSNGEEHCTLVPRTPQLNDASEAYQERVEHLSVTVYRVQGEKSVPVKSVVRTGGKRAKASFQDAMKALQKESKKARVAK